MKSAGQCPRSTAEVVLAGGNLTPVVRVGDTVRRAARRSLDSDDSRFMPQLHAAGFSLVPRPLGVDDHGREVISLLPGVVATYPLPQIVWSDPTVIGAARVLRAFHDARVGSVPKPGACWQWPAHHPAQVVCHDDFGPYNLMFEDETITGVIDLDLASPGPRVWDIAYAYRFVLLIDSANPDAPFPGVHAQTGLRHFSIAE